MNRILVTGANGFVGTALTRMLAEPGNNVRCAFRRQRPDNSDNAFYESVIVGDINEETKWSNALQNVDSIVHLAARVHVMDETDPDPLAAFRKVNVNGTKKLAYEAAKSGAKRFIFMSSIKVNGEATKEHPFTEEDTPAPGDPYGVSKCEAEQTLLNISKETGLEIVIIRPPLIYGPGVGGNFIRLLNWINRGIPLPLKSVDNRRSLVFVDNVADIIIRCINHPNAPGQTFFVSDGEDLSTPKLMSKLANAMKRPSRLVPFPPSVLLMIAKSIRKGDVAKRLLGSLQVDSGKANRILGWSPPISVDEGLSRTVTWYKTLGA